MECNLYIVILCYSLYSRVSKVSDYYPIYSYIRCYQHLRLRIDLAAVST